MFWNFLYGFLMKIQVTRIFFLIRIITHFRVISLLINNTEISYIWTVITVMGKQESGSVGGIVFYKH